MRSILLALALAAPLSAAAATTYTSPMSRQHVAKDATVYLTFINHTAQDRELLIGSEVYRVHYNGTAHISVPVGTVVREYSEMNSKLNGVELMQVLASDANRDVLLK